MDGGAWWATVHGATKSQTQEKEMTTHSTTLDWKILWTEEPSRLQSMGSQRVGHGRATSLHGKMSYVKHVHLNFNETTLCSLIKLLSTVHRKKKKSDTTEPPTVSLFTP